MVLGLEVLIQDGWHVIRHTFGGTERGAIRVAGYILSSAKDIKSIAAIISQSTCGYGADPERTQWLTVHVISEPLRTSLSSRET